MRTSRKTDYRSRTIAKNNFSGIDLSQGLDLEPPSLSPYFLLRTFMSEICYYPAAPRFILCECEESCKKKITNLLHSAFVIRRSFENY